MSAAQSTHEVVPTRIVTPWRYLPMRVRLANPMSDDELYEFCRANGDLRIERTEDGEIVIMPPTGGETGRRNLYVSMALGNWAERNGTGVAFDSSTGFLLPNGAERSPDAAWIRRERWDALTPAQREKFVPLCPDFVLELRSPTDSLAEQQAKMEEYVRCGLRLGWLLDPKTRAAHVYDAKGELRVVAGDGPIDGGDVLSGFTLDLARVWMP
jgi:Uma2 family endonuclease